MAYSCPECGCSAFMSDSARTSTGRRRRFHCRSLVCGYRWSEWNGKRPAPPPPPELSAAEREILAVREPRLTEAQVRLVLTRLDISAHRLAKLLGRSRQAICQVRTGGSYATVAPELPRLEVGQARRSCLLCKEWTGSRCRQGWPDPIEEGPEFARDCDDYRPKCQ